MNNESNLRFYICFPLFYVVFRFSDVRFSENFHENLNILVFREYLNFVNSLVIFGCPSSTRSPAVLRLSLSFKLTFDLPYIQHVYPIQSNRGLWVTFLYSPLLYRIIPMTAVGVIMIDNFIKRFGDSYHMIFKNHNNLRKLFLVFKQILSGIKWYG